MNRLRTRAQDTKDTTVVTPKDIQLLSESYRTDARTE